MADIYLLIEGAQKGPFTVEQLTRYLAQGHIGNDQPAWREGLAGWVAVRGLLPETAKPIDQAQPGTKRQEITPSSKNASGPMLADIYLLYMGSQQGPFPVEKIERYLAQGRITVDQRAWREGMADWVAVKDLLPEICKPAKESQTEAESQKRGPSSDELNGAISAADIYLLIEGGQQGPFTAEKIKRYLAQGRISHNQPAWREGLAEWVGIQGLLTETAEPAVEAPSVEQVSGDQISEEQPTEFVQPTTANDPPSAPTESIQESVAEAQPITKGKPRRQLNPRALVGFLLLVLGIIAAAVMAVSQKPNTLALKDVTELLRLHAAQPRSPEATGSSITSAVSSTKKPRVIEVDANMRVNGAPILSPVFQIEGSKVTFKGGDYRNTVLDFRNTETKAFAMAEVLSDVGCYGLGDQRKYGVGLLLDENDREAFFDDAWVYYSGSLRKVDSEGPFATVYVVCTNNGNPAEGVQVEMGGILKQTADNGWVQFNLKNIQDRIMPVKITSPNSEKTIEKRVALPVVSASGKLDEKYGIYNVVYKTILVELTE